VALSKVFSRRADAFALFTCLVTPHFGTAASERRFVSTCGRCAKPIRTRKARKPEHASEGLGSDGEWSCLLHGNMALAISTRFQCIVSRSKRRRPCRKQVTNRERRRACRSWGRIRFRAKTAGSRRSDRRRRETHRSRPSRFFWPGLLLTE